MERSRFGGNGWKKIWFHGDSGFMVSDTMVLLAFFVLGILLRLQMKLLNLLKFLDCLKHVSLMPRSFFFVNDVCFPGQLPLIHHDLSLSGKKHPACSSFNGLIGQNQKTTHP